MIHNFEITWVSILLKNLSYSNMWNMSDWGNEQELYGDWG